MGKTFDEIIKEINAGLTGDYEKDMKYLDEKSHEYKDHEMGKEILRACGRLMYEIMPEEKKQALNKAIEKDRNGDRAVIDEIRFNIYKKEYDKALKMLEDYEKKIVALGLYEDDKVSEYFQFDEFMQEIIYKYRNKPEKAIRAAQSIPYCEVYMLYGGLLVELKRLEEARTMLKKGLRWNPLNFDMTMEYIETFKMEGNIDKAFELTIDAFKIAIHPAQLARCYRNLGFIFVEKKLYSEATACYIMSDQFEKDAKQTQSELYYIQHVTGKTFNPSMKDFEAYSKKYGFPIGADDDIVGLAYNYGKHFLKEGEFEGAKYCLGIAYELTEDESIKKILAEIPE